MSNKKIYLKYGIIDYLKKLPICKCHICKRSRAWDRAIKRKDFETLNKIYADMFLELMQVTTDYEMLKRRVKK